MFGSAELVGCCWRQVRNPTRHCRALPVAAIVKAMRLVLLFALLAGPAAAQAPLRQQIGGIAAEARGTVSVACSLPGTALNCDLNPHAHPPMQSVFKLPLAMTMLHQIEKGRHSLDEPVRFMPEDRILPHAYSPLQDKYPDAGVELRLRDVMQWTVGLSDNAASEILLRVVGGPRVVDEYIASLGVAGFQMQDGEQGLHRETAAQYRNWVEPTAAVQLLQRIVDGRTLTPEHAKLLQEWMKPTGQTHRLNADLPAGTRVAHKSGTSDVDNGLAHATNDIGLITLPDGRQLAIAVFVTDSTADETTREKVIARIGRAAYDAAVKTH